MRTKEDIEYDLKRMDEDKKIADMLLEKMKSNEKIMDNLSRCKMIFSDCADKLSNLKIELPPAPELREPPIADPEQTRKTFELIEKVLNELRGNRDEI